MDMEYIIFKININQCQNGQYETVIFYFIVQDIILLTTTIGGIKM